jgi:hypothetical protein
MFGLRPDGTAAGGCCACAVRICAPEISAEAAANVVLPSRMPRRLSAPSPIWFRSFCVVMMLSSLMTRRKPTGLIEMSTGSAWRSPAAAAAMVARADAFGCRGER